MADSAFDYVAVLANVSSASGIATYQLNTVIADSGKPTYISRVGVPSTYYNDSGFESLAEQIASSAASYWVRAAEVDSDAPGFDPANFIGDTYEGRYKVPIYNNTPVTITNELTQKVGQSVVEDSDTITYDNEIQLLDSDEKALISSRVTLTKEQLFDRLKADGVLEQVMVKVGRNPMLATWDASAGAGYTWASNQINGFGIDSVQRLDVGKFRIHFKTALEDSNYSVITAVGADDYSGTGGSPRQLHVLSDLAGIQTTHLDVLCERTDDAVNEDNSFNSVTITPGTLLDSAYVDVLSKTEFQWNGPVMTKIRAIKGIAADSDFRAWMLNSPGNY